MKFNVIIDWKFIAALGASVVGYNIASKMDSNAAEKVLTHGIDTFKELVFTGNSDC